MNLKKRAISGLKWSTASKFGQQVLQFSTLAILARLLLPEDFGLMASAMVVIYRAVSGDRLGQWPRNQYRS